jgi:hypothetical protein
MKLKTSGLNKIYPNGAMGVEKLDIEVEEGQFAVL